MIWRVRASDHSLVLLHEDPPHLPRGHLAIVSVGVVVPLYGDEVGVKGEERGRHETLVLRPPQAWRQGQVAQLIKYLDTILKFYQ